MGGPWPSPGHRPGARGAPDIPEHPSRPEEGASPGRRIPSKAGMHPDATSTGCRRRRSAHLPHTCKVRPNLPMDPGIHHRLPWRPPTENSPPKEPSNDREAAIRPYRTPQHGHPVRSCGTEEREPGGGGSHARPPARTRGEPHRHRTPLRGRGASHRAVDAGPPAATSSLRPRPASAPAPRPGTRSGALWIGFGWTRSICSSSTRSPTPATGRSPWGTAALWRP